MATQKIDHQKAFNMLFFLEFWERFGYYGLQAVLASFFVKSLGMDDAESFIVFGAFSAMVYGYADGTMTQKYLEETEEIEAVLADKGEIRRILKEENVAAPCAYQLMHFLADPEPFGFLASNKEI